MVGHGCATVAARETRYLIGVLTEISTLAGRFLFFSFFSVEKRKRKQGFLGEQILYSISSVEGRVRSTEQLLRVHRVLYGVQKHRGQCTL